MTCGAVFELISKVPWFPAVFLEQGHVNVMVVYRRQACADMDV